MLEMLSFELYKPEKIYHKCIVFHKTIMQYDIVFNIDNIK